MRLQFEHTIHTPARRVFEFHANPANLGRVMEGWPGFRLLSYSDNVRPGAQVWFEQTVGGCIPVAMGFRHDVYEPPVRFAERLIHGPFSRFDHAHEFEERNALCTVRDTFDIELPWYYGGEWFVRAYVAPALRQVFVHRNRALDREFGSAT